MHTHQFNHWYGSYITELATLSNEPSEHVELHREVMDLLKKGIIRENMSPCMVPTLLMPGSMDHGGFASIVSINWIIIKYWFPIPWR